MPLPIVAGAGAIITAKVGAASTALSTGGMSAGTVKYLSYLGIAGGTLAFREGVIYAWEKINQGRGDPVLTNPALINPVPINRLASDSQFEPDISEKMSAIQTQVLEDTVKTQTQVLKDTVKSPTQVLEDTVESWIQMLEDTVESRTQMLEDTVESPTQVPENIDIKKNDRIKFLEKNLHSNKALIKKLESEKKKNQRVNAKAFKKLKHTTQEITKNLDKINKETAEKIDKMQDSILATISLLFLQIKSIQENNSRNSSRGRSIGSRRSEISSLYADSRSISPNPTHIPLDSTLPPDNQEFDIPDPSPSFCNVTTGANQDRAQEAEQEVEEYSDQEIGSSSQAHHRDNASVRAQMLGFSPSSSLSESSYGTMSTEHSLLV